MDNSVFSNLRFDRQPRSVPRRLFLMGLTFLLFNLLWWQVSETTLYWLLLSLLGGLVWVASYGWRGALAALHDLIHRLEQL